MEDVASVVLRQISPPKQVLEISTVTLTKICAESYLITFFRFRVRASYHVKQYTVEKLTWYRYLQDMDQDEHTGEYYIDYTTPEDTKWTHFIVLDNLSVALEVMQQHTTAQFKVTCNGIKVLETSDVQMICKIESALV